MARVTVEDCIDKIPNKYKLILLAAYRAKELSQGAMPTLERQDDKNPVIGLREIAASTPENKNSLNYNDLSEYLVHSMQKHVEVDEAEEDVIPRLQYAESTTHNNTTHNNQDPQDIQNEQQQSHRNDAENKEQDKKQQTQNQPLSEEDFLRGLSGLPPAANPGSSRSGL